MLLKPPDDKQAVLEELERLAVAAPPRKRDCLLADLGKAT